MKCEELFRTIDSLQDKYVAIWERACNLESPTANKKAVDAVGEFFVSMARERGWQVEVLPLETAGNPICITLNPEAEAAPVTFSGHIDTVHPIGLFGSPAVHKDAEKIYGPGVMDCKGGVVASFMAMEALEKCGFKSRPVQLVIQTDEETGSKTSGKKTVEFMLEKARGSVAFLNAEGSDGDCVVIIRKGILRCKFNVHGRAAHSSRCPEGANAVAEAAYKILELEKMKDLQGLTCNCGVISGGTVANAVAAECSFLADVRFVDPEDCEKARKILAEVAATTYIPGCSCDLEQVSFRPSMPLAQRNVQLLDEMNRIYEANGLPVLAQAMNFGGSDAAYMTEAEIPCVDSVGVAGGRIHSAEEYAFLSSLPEAAKRLAAVAYCI